MTEENYNYRTSQIMLRNQLPGERKMEHPDHSEILGKARRL